MPELGPDYDDEEELIEEREVETHEGDDSSLDDEEIKTEEEINELNSGNDLEALLELSSDLREEDQESFTDCCRVVFAKNFQTKAPQSIEDAEREFSYFLAHVKRLIAIREVITPELVDGKPSNEENKIIASLAVLISNEIPIEKPSEDATTEEIASATENVDQDLVRQMIRSLNLKFSELSDNQFSVYDKENDVIIINPKSPQIKGYDHLSIAYQILAAKVGKEEPELEEETEEGVYPIGEQAIKWFSENGIDQEDLNSFRRFKHPEAYALAGLVRTFRQNPKEGKVSAALDGEYRLMIDFTKKDPDKDWKISDTISKAYKPDLDKFRDKWEKISKTGIDIDQLPIQNAYNYDSDGPEDSGSSNMETQSGSSGDLEKKGSSGVAKGERAGGKNTGPKNMKEAVFQIFQAADGEFAMAFNPVAAAIGLSKAA